MLILLSESYFLEELPSNLKAGLLIFTIHFHYIYQVKIYNYFQLCICMEHVDKYLYDLMKKILDSYNIIDNLGDSKDDLFTLDMELVKINGLLKVLLRKTNEFSDKNSEFLKLNKKVADYFENHFFENELEKIKEIYSEDPHRVKSIRKSIVNSLQDNKLIFRVYEIAKELK